MLLTTGVRGLKVNLPFFGAGVSGTWTQVSYRRKNDTISEIIKV
jgi:hypothetical protein